MMASWSAARSAWLAAAVVSVVAAAWPVTDSVALHVLQHVALISAIPVIVLRVAPVLASGSPLPVGRGLALILAGVLVVYAAHVPAVFEADLGSAAVRLGMHAVLLAAGLLITVPVSGERCVVGIAGVALVAVAELGIGALGMWLAWIPELVYRLPEDGERRFGLSAGSDQSLAGAFILVLAEPLLAYELVILLFRTLDDNDDEDEEEDLAP